MCRASAVVAMFPGISRVDRDAVVSRALCGADSEQHIG